MDTVTAQLDSVVAEKVLVIRNLTADLESEREARRGLQEKAKALRENVAAMVCLRTFVLQDYAWLTFGQEQARFVLVLIDADADIHHVRYILYLFPSHPNGLSVS